jgi:hypothetical protein
MGSAVISQDPTSPTRSAQSRRLKKYRLAPQGRTTLSSNQKSKIINHQSSIKRTPVP